MTTRRDGETYDVIVIGAGLGGARCAGPLAKRGLGVPLAENNATVGGHAMSGPETGDRHLLLLHRIHP